MTLTVKLTKPIAVNGVTVNALTLREPTVGDQLHCRKMAAGDDGQFELLMFANISGAAPDDLHALTLRDYKSLQDGYFRLVSGEPDITAG